ncbi:hypothetical protein DSO57_1014103 [Entomophthora muscae]|uniref:Uncharacterized protein n=1 Tax=Entomophthora muscae TaxID=34485 RepID=A0ACC2UQA4_9FUNG|nr:hypothetical protein DSO57_1014103 [Entomophthora muscae]
MQFSTFFSAVFIFGAALATELEQTKCTGWNVTILGMYAFPWITNSTHCYEGTVRCIEGGYEQCTNNKFVPKHCECEGYFCHKSGQSLTCQPTP